MIHTDGRPTICTWRDEAQSIDVVETGEPETIELDDDTPEMIHLTEPLDPTNTVALCGCELSGEILDEEDEPVLDCVVCAAEAERRGIPY